MDYENKLNNLAVSSDTQLKDLAKKLNIRVDAILDLREINKPLPKKGSFIILLRKVAGVGHWVSVYNNYYFDSMGNPPPEKLKISSYNKKQYQSTYSEYCGLWALLFLYSKQHNKPDLLNNYYDLNTEVYV